MRGSAYTGPGWRALHCSHKTVLGGSLDSDELYELVRAGLHDLVRGLPARVRDEAVDLGAVACAMRKVAPSLVGFSARRVPYPDEPSLSDVRELRAHFDGQIFSQIDKENGELAVLCQITQYRVMESGFPRTGGRYKVLARGKDVAQKEQELMQKCIDKVNTENWTLLAPLYGVRKSTSKVVPDRCCVPAGYATIKGKSWIAMIVKGRPITPHTRHCMKRISNTVARGYHVVLISINSERVTRMWTT